MRRPPWFRGRDEGAWGIPKGELRGEEEPLAAACREFAEETGVRPSAPYLALGEVRQRGGKRVRAWAFEGDCDPTALVSNEFEMEWPPRSGRRARFPEVDRIAFFSLEEAARRINPGQQPLLQRLGEMLGGGGGGAAPGEGGSG